MDEKKHVLVTGATGLIGSHIVEALLKRGDTFVTALARNIEKLRDCFAQYLGNPNFRCLAWDVSIPLLPEEMGLDIIFHAAGVSDNDTITKTPVDIIRPNLLGTLNCLELLRTQKRGRLVVFSSSVIYEGCVKKDALLAETDTKLTQGLNAPRSVYEQTKRMVEILAQSYWKQYGVDAVIARISTAYGYTCFPPHTSFYEFMQKAVSGEDIIINTSGLPRTDRIYVDDAVSALLAVSEKGIAGEVYNVSTGGELGNYAAHDEIAQMIADRVNERVCDRQVRVLYSEEPKLREPGFMLDNTKLKALNWIPKTSLYDGVAQSVDDYLAARGAMQD